MFNTELKRIGVHGNSSIVHVTKECRQYGLGKGDEIFVVTAPVEEKDDIMARLHGPGSMFFVACMRKGKGMLCEVRRGESEIALAESIGSGLITLLGPFSTLEEARGLKLALEDSDVEASEQALKAFLRKHLAL